MTTYGNQGGIVLFDSISMTTASLGANDPKPGDRVQRDGAEYLFVYNAASDSALPTTYGAIVSGVSGYSVTISSVTSVDVCVGVAINTIATGAYGWILTKGFATVEMEADSSGAAGALITLAADGEFANKTISTGYPGAVAGKLMDATASGASGLAYISVF